jgi:hypothetical protein
MNPIPHDLSDRYTQLTYPYDMTSDRERKWLEEAAALLRLGNIDYQVVHLSGNKAEIWRSASKVRVVTTLVKPQLA